MFSRWFRVGEAYSTFTLDQSHSSSSATIMGSEVIAPCHISVCGERMRIVPLGSIDRNALISFGAVASPYGVAPMTAAPAALTLIARPPAAVKEATTNWRRDSLVIWFMASSLKPSSAPRRDGWRGAD